MENTIYNLTDLQTGTIIETYGYAKRNVARNRAEHLNMQYGAHRYAACPVFDRESDIETVGTWDGVGLVDTNVLPKATGYKIDFSKMGSN